MIQDPFNFVMELKLTLQADFTALKRNWFEIRIVYVHFEKKCLKDSVAQT